MSFRSGTSPRVSRSVQLASGLLGGQVDAVPSLHGHVTLSAGRAVPESGQGQRVQHGDVREGRPAFFRPVDEARRVTNGRCEVEDESAFGLSCSLAWLSPRPSPSPTYAPLSAELSTPPRSPEAAWHGLSHLIGVLRAVDFTARR